MYQLITNILAPVQMGLDPRKGMFVPSRHFLYSYKPFYFIIQEMQEASKYDYTIQQNIWIDRTDTRKRFRVS